MSLAAILSGIFAIAEAIPALRDLLDKVVNEWNARALQRWDKEKRDGLRKLIDEKDQRDLEKAIGNPRAGEPSGDFGAIIKPGKPPIVH